MKALQQQQQQQQQKLSGWGNVSKPAGTAKSLLEIQQEEARQMQKQQQHQQPSRARNNPHSNLHTSLGNSVWGSINAGPPNQWASDLVSSIWSNADTKNSNMGFWDDAVKEVGPRNSTNKNKNNASLRAYLGDTSEAKEFAKQFLERRAKQKASQRQPQQQQPPPQQQDSVWGMNHSALHSVFQTNQSNNQQSNFEAVQSGKKKKKQKMVRADPSLLVKQLSPRCTPLAGRARSRAGMAFRLALRVALLLLSGVLAPAVLA
ncbi:hypothetical protein E2I00_008543, partial [Balaenoptera physalus]